MDNFMHKMKQLFAETSSAAKIVLLYYLLFEIKRAKIEDLFHNCLKSDSAKDMVNLLVLL